LINLAHDVLTDNTKGAAYDRQRAAVGWRPSVSGLKFDSLREHQRFVQVRLTGLKGPRLMRLHTFG
jgi:hypothetical protein